METPKKEKTIDQLLLLLENNDNIKVLPDLTAVAKEKFNNQELAYCYFEKETKNLINNLEPLIEEINQKIDEKIDKDNIFLKALTKKSESKLEKVNRSNNQVEMLTGHIALKMYEKRNQQKLDEIDYLKSQKIDINQILVDIFENS